MSKSLSKRANLENFRKQAKSILKKHRKGDPSVCATLRLLKRFARPEGSSKGTADSEILDSKVKLSDCQFALAMEYGCKNWADLKKQILFKAVENGNLEEVEKWISSGSDIEVKTDINETPLMWGASLGHLDIVKYLVEEGADINTQYDAGNTPLIVASWHGHLPVVEYLVEQGADIHIRNKDGHQGIHWAAEHGHLDIVKFLHDCGASLDSSVLTEACEDGHLDIVKYLLSQGVSIEPEEIGEDGFSPLVAASYKGYTDIVQLLLDNGADIHVGNDAALGWACGFEKIKVAEILIANGANVNGIGGEGLSFIEEAQQKGKKKVVDLLLKHGAGNPEKMEPSEGKESASGKKVKTTRITNEPNKPVVKFVRMLWYQGQKRNTSRILIGLQGDSMSLLFDNETIDPPPANLYNPLVKELLSYADKKVRPWTKRIKDKFCEIEIDGNKSKWEMFTDDISKSLTIKRIDKKPSGIQNTRIMYVELKTHPNGRGDRGPAHIGIVKFSKSGRTIYYRGKKLQRTKGPVGYGNYSNFVDLETGDQYWVSGPKKDGKDRHYALSTPILIDEDVREKYWTEIRKQPENVNKKTT